MKLVNRVTVTVSLASVSWVVFGVLFLVIYAAPDLAIWWGKV